MAKSVTQNQLKTVKSEMEPAGIDTWTWIVKKMLQKKDTYLKDTPLHF